MVTITESARTAIESILAGAPDPARAGLRIARSTTEADKLALRIVESPVEGDAVVGAPGSRIFIEPEVAAVLGDRTLDAVPGVSGAVEFRIGEVA